GPSVRCAWSVPPSRTSDTTSERIPARRRILASSSTPGTATGGASSGVTLRSYSAGPHEGSASGASVAIAVEHGGKERRQDHGPGRSQDHEARPAERDAPRLRERKEHGVGPGQD